MTLDEILEIAPYSLCREEKRKMLDGYLLSLTEYHYENYELATVQRIGKISALYKAAANLDLAGVSVKAPFVTRLKVDELNDNIMNYRYNSGFFYEYDADSLTELLPIANGKCQTVTYFGLTRGQIIKFVNEGHPKGIDRFVPMGKSMDFTLVWDGYDLITTLSRIVNVI